MSNTNTNSHTVDHSSINICEVVQVTTDQLPLACPPAATWNMHPRVYLQFDKHNQAQCPYCGARYCLR